MVMYALTVEGEALVTRVLDPARAVAGG